MLGISISFLFDDITRVQLVSADQNLYLTLFYSFVSLVVRTHGVEVRVKASKIVTGL